MLNHRKPIIKKNMVADENNVSVQSCGKVVTKVDNGKCDIVTRDEILLNLKKTLVGSKIQLLKA